MKNKIKHLFFAVLLPLAVGGLSALISKNGFKVFQTMAQPPLSPPAWLFPVAWTILYILMGVASFFIYEKPSFGGERKKALRVYGEQLFFNFFWTIIFFNFKSYLIAFFWLIVLLVLIAESTVRFFRLDKKAGALLLPYLLWTIFAAYLNIGVYLMNR